MRSTYRQLLAGAVMALAVAAAGVAQAAPVKITFWEAMGGAKGAALQSLVDTFEAAHPDIQVQLVNEGNYDVLEQKLVASLKAHNSPTIAQVYNEWTALLVEAQALTPLGNYADQATLSDLYPSFIPANTWNGQLYTLPFNKDVYELYYNKDLFKAAGLSVPTDMVQFRQASSKIKAFSGKMGFVIAPNFDEYGVFLRNFGGKWLGEDGKAAFDSATGIEALQYLVDLTANDKTAALTNGYPNTMFDKGDAAMFIDTSTNLAYVAADKPTFAWGTAPLPHQGPLQAPVNGTDIALFASATDAQKQAAWQFVQFLLGTEQTVQWASATGYLPVTRSGIASSTYEAWIAQAPDQRRAAADELEHAAFDPGVVHWDDVRNLVTPALQKVLVEHADVATTLHQAAAQANAALAQ